MHTLSEACDFRFRFLAPSDHVTIFQLVVWGGSRGRRGNVHTGQRGSVQASNRSEKVYQESHTARRAV